MALTPKQQRFVEEYLVDLNATQAAIRAGYSEKTAHSSGPRLLDNVGVASEIERRQSRVANKLEITAERVLTEISRMAFYDPGSLTGVRREENGDYSFDGIGGPEDIRDLPEDVRRAIVGWSWDKAGNFTLKLADKGRALDQLARHLGLFNDKVDVNLKGSFSERIMEARNRARSRD